MSDPVVKTENLTRDYGRLRALDSVDVDIPPGRVVALLGPNGAGKSTFLRLLGGLLEPTEGTAWILGSSARAMPTDVCARIASMHEGHEPPRWATAHRLIEMQEAVSPRFNRSHAERLCSERELPLRKPYGTLSKGQKRWLLATLALASRADLLLLDEPADGLDPSARRALYDHLRDYVSEHESTAIVATHIIHDIERVADDVALIASGRITLHAALEDLREQFREIELPEESEIPNFDDSITLIGSKQAPGATLVWVKTDGSKELLRRQLVVRQMHFDGQEFGVQASACSSVAKMQPKGCTPNSSFVV